MRGWRAARTVQSTSTGSQGRREEHSGPLRGLERLGLFYHTVPVIARRDKTALCGPQGGDSPLGTLDMGLQGVRDPSARAQPGGRVLPHPWPSRPLQVLPAEQPPSVTPPDQSAGFSQCLGRRLQWEAHSLPRPTAGMHVTLPARNNLSYPMRVHRYLLPGLT